MSVFDISKRILSFAASEAVKASTGMMVSNQNVKDIIEKWNRKWVNIGPLKTADLSRYNHCVGLYKHVVNGEVKYIGRATELHNGGLRKRLSDYRRPDGGARKHSSGQMIYNHLDKITTYVLVVGDTDEAVAKTRELEKIFISYYRPEWNKQVNF